MDIQNLVQQAHKLQQNLKSLQEDLEKREATGTAGAGMVSAVFNGRFELVDLRIDAELVRQVMAVQHYTAHHREELEQYNPDNGWGTYDQLLRAEQDLLIALLDIPVSDYGDYLIYCWT